MVMSILPFAAAARSDDPNEWEKTQPYKTSVAKYLAMPGQYLVKSIAPLLIGDSLKGIADSLYTNDIVNMIMLAQRAIEFDISQGNSTSHQFLRPLGVVSSIEAFPDSKEKYESVAAALKTVQIGGTTGATSANTALEWAGVDELIANGELDWGVTDRESFIEAAGIALRPLLRLLTHRTLNFRGEDGVYATAIIPGLEALGCKNILSLEDFETAYQAAIRVVGNPINQMMSDLYAINAKMKADFALAAILNPILDLLEELEADALGTIVRILPNAAYHRDDLTAFINAAVENNGELTMIFEGLGGAFGIDLSGSIEDVVANALAGLGLKLPPIPWKELAGAGDLDKDTNTVIADECIVYAVLTDFLSDTVNGDPKGVRNMIADAMGVPKFLAFIVYFFIKILLFFAKPF